MKRVYKAVLHGDRVEWLDGAPPDEKEPLPIHVILDKPRHEYLECPTLLHKDKVEWLEETPSIDCPVPTYIVVLDNLDVHHPDNSGAMMVAMFEILADKGTFDEIEDPVAWQREIRKDRPLPFRDYDVD